MNTDSFNPAIDELAPRVLHGVADDSDRTELASLLAQSAENRRRFLDHTALHGMLAREAKAGRLAQNTSDFFQELEKTPRSKSRHLVRFWLPAAAAMLFACFTAMILMPTRATAALDRIIIAMNEARDRTYQIEVIDQDENQPPPRNNRGRFPVGNHLDGATLWLRGKGEFVLSQRLPDGSTRLMGSDQSGSWSFRENGPVHVSDDPSRFGGWIFAKSGEFAFLDLRSQLEDLRKFYQLEPLDHASPSTWKIRGSRHSKDQGGPREIELWFNPDTGSLDRMILRELPRDNGGPRSIAITLQSTDPLPPDFFQHQSHHDHARPTTKEP